MSQKRKLLLLAVKRLVALGDDPGISMTCESGQDSKPCVRLGCQSLKHAQDVHETLIDIVSATRELDIP